MDIMRNNTSTNVVLGVGSLVSGAAALVAPAPMGQLYGIPARLMRPFAVRDIAIGAAMVARPRARGPLRARGISDAFDTLVIARDAFRHRTNFFLSAGRVLLGAALATYALMRTA